MEITMINVLEMGAVGDGKTLDSPVIQKALDECRDKGGGVVCLPGGKEYKCGSLILYSNTELHIETGATIKASDDMKDYKSFGEITKNVDDGGVPSYINCEYNGKPANFFIYACGGENIRITGGGTIDGREEMYYGLVTQYHIEGKYYPRTPLLFIENVKHFTVKDVTLTRSAFWTLHMVGCEDVLVEGIRILNNMKLANCDGIDPDHCRNVRIIGCHIETADDCIVFKTSEAYEEYGPTENIVVSGCTLMTTSAAIKFGSESESDFRNISVSNCVIYKTNRAVSFQLRDKGNIENIQISGLVISTRAFYETYWGKGEPVSITAVERHPGRETGTIRNVRISNLDCDSECGLFVFGNSKKPIENVTLENISLRLRKKSRWEFEGYDIRPTDDKTPVGDGRIYGIYADHVRGLELKNFKVSVDDSMKDKFEKDIFNGDDCR